MRKRTQDTASGETECSFRDLKDSHAVTMDYALVPGPCAETSKNKRKTQRHEIRCGIHHQRRVSVQKLVLTFEMKGDERRFSTWQGKVHKVSPSRG